MTSNKLISKKQLEANQKNSKFAGVKSEKGKAITRLNAVQHGCLTCYPLNGETPEFESFIEQLTTEYGGLTVAERIYIERCAIHMLQLKRIDKAKSEFFKMIDEPRVIDNRFDNLFPDEIVIEKGYQADITPEQVETLFRIYNRYETAIENRLYKALNELRKSKK